MNIPDNLKYTAEHEWLKVEENNVVIIGITDYAQSELGDIVYVEIETLDEELDQNAVFGTVEAVKTVSDLFMPVKGKVVALNEELAQNPEMVNEDPYEKGWMIKVEVDNPADLDDLMSVDDYKSHIQA